jgi:L-lactate dehydrogenase (cytochrome)
VRNGFALPAGLSVANLVGHGKGAVSETLGDSGLAAYVATMLDPSLTWRDVEWLRSITRLPVIVKGVVRADDTRSAAAHGASAVVVSNHGGRQLDGALSPMRALPAAVQQAGDMAVMIDSGFRRGTDILKALGLGAQFVFIGRPFNYASALAGEAGVDHAIALLRTQLSADLGMLGLRSLQEMNRDVLFLDNFKAVAPR